MIINGGSRRNSRFFALHLTRADENERVSIAEIRGLAAEDVREALREMDALASGSRCKNHFYHANINPREGEQLTPEQWEQAVDRLEGELNLTGHSRFIVEHEKQGRTHRHVIWSRIDTDSMTAVSDSNNYAAHERAARALEAEFGHEKTKGVHVDRDRDAERPERRPENWETFRGHDSGIDPADIKAEVTELWRVSDNGAAFHAALTERGYILARGDRRDFCIIDQAGDEHSLARRIQGAKAADIRARLADLDRDALPTVAEARDLARAESQHRAESGEAQPEPSTPDALREEASPSADYPDTSQAPPEAAASTATPPPHTADPPQERESAFDAFTRDMRAAMREEEAQSGDRAESRYADGLNWWERSAVILADFADEVSAWAKERWQSFTERLQSERAPQEPDIDMER